MTKNLKIRHSEIYVYLVSSYEKNRLHNLSYNVLWPYYFSLNTNWWLAYFFCMSSCKRKLNICEGSAISFIFVPSSLQKETCSFQSWKRESWHLDLISSSTLFFLFLKFFIVINVNSARKHWTKSELENPRFLNQTGKYVVVFSALVNVCTLRHGETKPSRIYR